MSERELRVTGIVLNWNNWRNTVQTVRLLRKFHEEDLPIIVIDNASAYPAELDLLGDLNDIIFIQNTRNLGFGGGCNVGIRRAFEARAQAVWIVNPDVEVEPDTLRGLVDTMLLDDRVGFVGPKFCFKDNRNLIRNAGKLLTLEDGVLPALPMGHGQEDGKEYQRLAVEVAYVRGSCMLVRRTTIEDIGLIPEEYFLYWEELAWCHTALARGWKVLVNQRVKVYDGHWSGFAHKPLRYYYYIIRNHLHFTRKYYPGHLAAATKRDVRRIAHFVSNERSRGLMQMIRTVIWCTRGLADAILFKRIGPVRVPD